MLNTIDVIDINSIEWYGTLHISIGRLVHVKSRHHSREAYDDVLLGDEAITPTPWARLQHLFSADDEPWAVIQFYKWSDAQRPISHVTWMPQVELADESVEQAFAVIPAHLIRCRVQAIEQTSTLFWINWWVIVGLWAYPDEH